MSTRTRVSSKFTGANIMLAIIAVFIFYSGYQSYIDNKLQTKDTFTLSFLILIIGVILYLLSRAKQIDYDNEFMYVSFKNETEKIHLGSIIKIKLTMTKVNDYNLWKIWYINEEMKKKSVRILPNNEFENFQNCIKTHNSNLKIQNWSWSFDMDQ